MSAVSFTTQPRPRFNPARTRCAKCGYNTGNFCFVGPCHKCGCDPETDFLLQQTILAQAQERQARSAQAALAAQEAERNAVASPPKAQEMPPEAPQTPIPAVAKPEVMSRNVSPIELVLSRLAEADGGGGKWTAKCPGHDDRSASLSICEKDGKVLLYCFAGCAPEAIVSALGLQMSDLFGEGASGNRVAGHPKPLTVAGLAAAKKLPVEFLKTFGLEDSAAGVTIPYFLPDGSPAPRQRVRSYLEHANGWCWWAGKDGPIVPYGLNRLADARRTGYVVLAEGETDVLTLFYHGFPALGIPGAQMANTLAAEHLTGIPKVFILQEADAGGQNFVSGVTRRLREISFNGEARIVSLAPMKDANELHCASPERFKAVFQSALDSARKPSTPVSAKGFTLTPLGDLMSEPEERVSWLLEGILPTGGLSLLAAKPKTGKSTLARCLALAVARGESFLGRTTQKGAVIYLALEEKRSEVRSHFQSMGATGQEEIFIHAASAPTDALPAITVEVKRRRPVLLIIDPALRFVRVRDANDYAEISAALEPILTLARDNGAHVLLVYHLGKGERAEATDAILGSTAFFAAVDTAVVMKRCLQYRTLQTRQRYGADLAETTLEFDSESRVISLGAERSRAEGEAVAFKILEFLGEVTEPKTEPEITENVEGKTQVVAGALRALLREEKVARAGEGKRGSPYRYSISPSSPSTYIVGSREGETEKVAQTRENTGSTLLPVSEQKSFLLPEEKGAPEPAISTPQNSPGEPVENSPRKPRILLKVDQEEV